MENTDYSLLADLHYAHQHGQDYVRSNYDFKIREEFEIIFKDQNVMYQKEFDDGVIYEENKRREI